MKISVRNKNDKLTKSEVKYAVNYFLSILLKEKHHIIDELEIEIKFEKLKQEFGTCLALDDSDGYAPRLFLIEIDRTVSKIQQLKTLAHECTHIKQYVLNEMKDHGPSTFTWKRKIIDTDKVDYWDLPSEIDAHGREIGLFHRYNDHLRSNKRLYCKFRKKPTAKKI